MRYHIPPLPKTVIREVVAPTQGPEPPPGYVRWTGDPPPAPPPQDGVTVRWTYAPYLAPAPPMVVIQHGQTTGRGERPPLACPGVILFVEVRAMESRTEPPRSTWFIRDKYTGELRAPTPHEFACVIWRTWARRRSMSP